MKSLKFLQSAMSKNKAYSERNSYILPKLCSVWQVDGTASECRRKSAGRWSEERVATLVTQWRDVDWLSTSIRLNILQAWHHIYSELPDQGVSGQLMIIPERVDWESVQTALCWATEITSPQVRHTFWCVSQWKLEQLSLLVVKEIFDLPLILWQNTLMIFSRKKNEFK